MHVSIMVFYELPEVSILYITIKNLHFFTITKENTKFMTKKIKFVNLIDNHAYIY